MGALGRIAPPDWDHVEKYPLTAPHLASITKPSPVVIGIDWFDEFDKPSWDYKGRFYYVENPTSRSQVRGGHCVCLKPRGVNDPGSWYDFYNQVNEGICVGEGCSRLSSLNNRRLYQPRWLYDECKKIDGDPNGEGTYVRCGLDVLKRQGHVRRKPGEPHALQPHEITRYPSAADGIAAYRWARSVDDVLQVLGYGDKDYVDVLNSWGRDGYPHLVRFSAEALETVFYRDGEFGIATDR